MRGRYGTKFAHVATELFNVQLLAVGAAGVDHKFSWNSERLSKHKLSGRSIYVLFDTRPSPEHDDGKRVGPFVVLVTHYRRFQRAVPTLYHAVRCWVISCCANPLTADKVKQGLEERGFEPWLAHWLFEGRQVPCATINSKSRLAALNFSVLSRCARSAIGGPLVVISCCTPCLLDPVNRMGRVMATNSPRSSRNGKSHEIVEIDE